MNLPADPFATRPKDLEARLQSLWYAANPGKIARGTEQWDPEGPLARALRKDEWNDVPLENGKLGPGQGRSILAWRGLWVSPRWHVLEGVMDAGLMPPPDQVDWFSNAYFRMTTLRSLFLPHYEGKDTTVSVQRAAQIAKSEASRQRVADVVMDRYPVLLDWFMQAQASQGAYKHPLAIAARPGHERDLARLLTWRGWDPLEEVPSPYQSRYSETPEVATEPRFTPVELVRLGIVRNFPALVDEGLRRGAKTTDTVLDKKDYPETLLHVAISMARPEMIARFVASGVHLEVVDRFGRTPFLRAATQGDVPALHLLQAAGANVHALDRFGQNALHCALSGVRTTRFSHFERFGGPVYEPLSRREIEPHLLRAAQAINALESMGLDSKQVAHRPKTKAERARLVGLPRAQAPASAAKEGETWIDMLMRRAGEDAALSPWGHAWFMQAKLEVALSMPWVPSEPEDEDMAPAPESSAPKRRMRF